ncbi:MAG: hypothetical protein ACI4MH_01315 [Candidatus Coproplasma sp.]
MAGYLKRIALIKTVSKGYSCDGGQLGGLVKCEVYAGFLKVELSLINFAPLADGRYRFGLSDGKRIVIFDNVVCETQTDFDLSAGFAALVCFCKDGSVKSVASAVCGENSGELERIERAIAGEEQSFSAPENAAYEDEAIAEVNYYELEANKNGGAVRADKKEEADGSAGGENEEAVRALQKGEDKDGEISDRADGQTARAENSDLAESAEKADSARGTGDLRAAYSARADENAHREGDKLDKNGAERADEEDKGFYGRMEGDIKKIFADYPKEERLERAMEGSRWAKIGYGGGKYYAFGVIYSDGKAKYLCYGVPSADGISCPRSLAGRASYMPVEGGGFWIMYQDAFNGISVKTDDGK